MYEVKKEAPEGHTPALEELVEFTKFINEYDPAEAPDDERAVKVWEEHLDITSFIRQLAVEWITGNWDAHQYCKL
jgi:spore coat protein CotH